MAEGLSGWNRVAGNRPHVLRALEIARRRAFFLAQAALELGDGFIFVFLHPLNHVAFDDANMFDAVPQ